MNLYLKGWAMTGVKLGMAAAMAAAAFGLATASAKADTIPVNGGWDVFEFGGVGSPVFDQYGNIDFTFDLTTANVLRITDGYFDGDQFDVIINGADQGPTSTPTVATSYVGDNWNYAFFVDGASYSHAAYLLGPGSYDVEAYMVQSPYGDGAGAFEVGGPIPVPEPQAWALMILGLGGIGGMARRRQRAAVA